MSAIRDCILIAGDEMDGTSRAGIDDKAFKELDAMERRLSALEALARKGLEVYHGGKVCRASLGTRPENPAECEYEACREWAKALRQTDKEAK